MFSRFSRIVFLAILLTDNSFLKSGVFLSSFWISLFSVFLFLSKKDFFKGLGELMMSPLSLGVSYVVSGIEVLSDLLKGKIEKYLPVKISNSAVVKPIVKLIIAVTVSSPVIFILLILLTLGDPIFGHYFARIFQELGKVFEAKFWWRPLAQFFFSLFLLSVLTPTVGMKIRNLSFKEVTEKIPFSKEAFILTLMVIAVMGIYLIVSWPYVFVSVLGGDGPVPVWGENLF